MLSAVGRQRIKAILARKKIPVTLSAKPLGEGGEAKIFTVNDFDHLVVKIYHQPTQQRQDKLVAMLDSPPADNGTPNHKSIAWPTDLILEENTGRFIGFAMPKVVGMYSAHDFFNPKSRQQICKDFNYQYLLRTARNIAAAIRSVHDKGHIVGDINESNVMVSTTALVTLVDTDSFQVQSSKGKIFRCPVGKPDYTAPELHGSSFIETDRGPEHDHFGLAVIVFQLLMEGSHPFAGCYVGPGDDPYPLAAQRIKPNFFPHGSTAGAYQPAKIAPPFEILSPNIQKLFMMAFEKGSFDPAVRPTPADWVLALDNAEKTLRTCPKNDVHKFHSHLIDCPWCERASRRGPKSSSNHSSAQRPLYQPPPQPQNFSTFPTTATTNAPTIVPVHIAWGKIWRGIMLVATVVFLGNRISTIRQKQLEGRSPVWRNNEFTDPSFQPQLPLTPKGASTRRIREEAGKPNIATNETMREITPPIMSETNSLSGNLARETVENDLTNQQTVSPSVQIVTKIESIPYVTQNVLDGTLPSGRRKLAQKGVNGEVVVEYQVTKYPNGQTERIEIARTITKEPRSRIIAIGARQEGSSIQNKLPKSDPGSNSINNKSRSEERRVGKD